MSTSKPSATLKYLDWQIDSTDHVRLPLAQVGGRIVESLRPAGYAGWWRVQYQDGAASCITEREWNATAQAVAA